MIPALNKSFYKNGYLLIIAAWLYTISFIFANYWFYTSSPNRVKSELEGYLKKSEAKFQAFAADKALLQAAMNIETEPEKATGYFRENIGLFVYTRNAAGDLFPVFWNTNIMLPDVKDLVKPDGKYLSNYASGSEFELVKKTVIQNGQEAIAVALIPVYWKYFFENEYLRSEFATIKDAEDRYQIVTAGADINVKNGDGKTLFGLKENKKEQNEDPGTWSLTLRILSVIFVLIFLNAYAFEVVEKKGWVKGFCLLAGVLLFFRLLSYRFSFPFNYDNLELFNPFIYASNSLHRSLGDLLINIILSLWLVSFVRFAATDFLKNLKDIHGRKGWLITFALSLFLIVISFISAGVIRSLITDSQISFNVTDFFSLNIYTLISFFILCLIVLTFFYFSHLALLFIYRCTQPPVYFKYIIIAFCGFLYLSFNLNSPSSSGNVLVLAWLLVYMLVMQYRKEDIFIPLLKSGFFIIWIIFFAGSISALIIYQNRAKSLDQRVKAAEDIARDEDLPAEFLLSRGITDIDSNFLSMNFKRLTNSVFNKKIKDSLINFYFSGYLNKYNTKLYTYDNISRPLFNDDTTSYSAINNIVINRGRRTGNPDIMYYENDFNTYNYLYHKEIRDSANNMDGYFFIVAEPNKYKSQAVFPELFKQGKGDVTDLDLTYAVYNKGELITSSGDYNFSSHIPRYQFLRQEYREEKKDDNIELWYNGGNNKLVILVTSRMLLFEVITLFAYLFVSFLFVIIMLQAVLFIIRNKFRFRLLKQEFKLTIRNQVQGAIIFISIFSFVVIGISTISFYISRFSQTNRERLVKAIKILGNEIETRTANHSFSAGTDDKPVSGTSQEGTLKKISAIHNVDANLYDLKGRLIVSTQPYIYNKQILSSMMEPMAYDRLHFNNEIQVIQKETVSHFSFLNIYVPVKDAAGKPSAYLNIPYLNTQKELNQEISNFLVTLINLNAFIFVIAGAIAVLLTNRITNSFLLIAGKMKDINLGKANEEIAWNTDDEIGALVNEYNKMVKKLEDSAHALAKSEREGAWREMARQVAHEIKNPLTPMKLSIQYLQRAIQDKSPNVQELSTKVSATLVEQMDQLAKIASDFSQFANIGNMKMEVIGVNEILTSLINLYGTNEKLAITYHHLPQPALISVDKTQISRLFTNLFQNAIEASDGMASIPIIIQEKMEANELHISVTDKGAGIPAEKQEKIFTPNFTTKTSGTGLGLAICKGIAEKANGRIWFDTTEGQGTTFHILLPVVAG